MTIVLALILTTTSHAWEPPPRPAPPQAADTDAPGSAEVYAGQSVPGWLVDGACTARHDFGALPIWRWQDYQVLERSYLPQLTQASVLEVERLELHLAMTTGRVTALEAEVTQLRMPEPWWQRPAAHRWQGRLEATAAFVGTAALLHWATTD